MAFTDYLSNRFAKAYAPVQDLLGDPAEEERKRRLKEAADEAANPTTPITQTVKTDPVTGEQEMTVTGRPEDLSGGPVMPAIGQPPQPGPGTQYAGPGVPTPVAPTGPDTGSYKTEADLRNRVADQQTPDQAVAAIQQEITSTARDLADPKIAPADKKLLQDYMAGLQARLPAARGTAERVATGRPPAGAVPPQQAGPVAPNPINAQAAARVQRQGAGPVNPAAAQAQAKQPQTAQGQWNLDNPQSTFAAIQQIQDPTEKSAAMTSFNQAMTKAGKALPDQLHAPVNDATDPKDLAKIVADPSAPPAQVAAASDKWADQTKTGIGMADAEKQFKATMAGPNPGNQFAKLLESQKDEGSYFKAYLYHRLGLTDLAKTEQEKLGAGTTWEPAYQPDGSIGLIKKNAQGMPLLGFHADGTAMDEDTLVAAASGSGMKGATTGGTMGKAPVNGEMHTISHTILPNGRGVIWKDETTGQKLPGAPAGYASVGSVNPVTKASIQVASTVEARMRKANTDAKTAGATAPYTEEDIQTEKAKVLNGESSPLTGGGPVASNVTSTDGGKVSAAQGTLPMSDSVAAKIARYEMKMPPGNSPGQAAIRRDVLKLNSGYDETKYETASKARKDFATGPQGNTVRALNVAVDHLEILKDTFAKNDNGGIPIWNQIVNDYKTNTGQAGPGSIEAARDLVMDEVVKAAAGGVTALGDRESMQKKVNAAQTPAQLADILKRLTQMMGSQAHGLKQQYEDAGLKDFDKKLLPRTKKVLSESSAESPTTNTNVTRSSW
jgi:hypothetical protein